MPAPSKYKHGKLKYDDLAYDIALLMASEPNAKFTANQIREIFEDDDPGVLAVGTVLKDLRDGGFIWELKKERTRRGAGKQPSIYTWNHGRMSYEALKKDEDALYSYDKEELPPISEQDEIELYRQYGDFNHFGNSSLSAFSEADGNYQGSEGQTVGAIRGAFKKHIKPNLARMNTNATGGQDET